jgi:hypothetical protein
MQKKLRRPSYGVSSLTKQEREELDDKIDAGAKAAVAEAVEEHRRAGRSIVVMRDGEVVTIQPEDIPPLEDSRVGDNL